ncbi:MAG TPA: AAA family ATPase [Acidimicrobiia bacterium]|nr:AAA family ATPase [Acidimicrobiia bacterium]
MATWSPPPLPGRFADPGPLRLIGRRQELETLEAVWELVEKGERQAVFLGGEPGSGKSRIASELGRAIHTQDAVVLLGYNTPDLSYPYQPLVDALHHLLTTTEEGSLAGLIPDSASELLRITPHVRRHRPDLENPDPTRKEYRRELFAAYVDLIKAIATERTVALFLEDMHWSSAPTRLLMSSLIESTEDTRLLVVATMRTTAPDRSDELSYALADLHRLTGVSRMDLAGFRLEDIERFLLDEMGADHPRLKESASLLLDLTGGNPFFLREVWREVPSVDGIPDFRTRRVALPLSVRDSLERRIRSFDQAARIVLEHAAVLGSEFAATDVIAAFGQPGAETLRALDQAVSAGLLGAVSGGGYCFQHALIRQALLEGLPPSRSAETHARLAECISGRYPTEPELAPLLARLYEGARSLGYRDELVFYLSEAAESASRSLAHEQAAELWEQGARAAGGDSSLRDRLLLSAARSHLLAGDFPQARRIYRELTASPDAATALQAAVGFEEASWRPGASGEEARTLLEGSIGRVPADPANPQYVGALISLSRAYSFSGDIESSGVIGDQALEMARHLGDDALVADALVAALLRVFSLSQSGRDFSELSAELRNIALRTGDYDRLGPAGANRASAGYVRGDPQAFRDGWTDLHLAAEKTSQPLWRWVDGCMRYCHEFISGDFGAATATAIRINELGYTFGADEAEGPFGLQMYMVKRETGGLEDVRGLISGDPAKDGTWSPGLLSLYTELGMAEPVRALLPSALALPETTTSQAAIYPAVIAFLTEAALSVADRPAVEHLMPYMAEYDGLNLTVGQGVAVFGSANSYLGRMHALLGDVDGADRHFRRALQMDVAIGSIVHQASTLAHYAEFLDTVDSSQRASDYRARARRLAEPIGQVRVLNRLDRVDGGGLPEGLTRRELEVLRLLAEGASNKEIGNRLFISANTAANHVRSILTKTGSPNRTAAAVFASERGLA